MTGFGSARATFNQKSITVEIRSVNSKLTELRFKLPQNYREKEFEIKKGKIRGQESHGMICAEDELGIGNNHDGIMVLDNSLKIILDCLQKVNAIKNDNNCIKIVAQKFIDKDRPRIEFKLIRI